GELPLERRRDRRGHRLRARPRQRRIDRDRGIVHRRQIAHRQLPVRHDAEQQNGRHHERRHDRTPDEQLGNAHGFFPPSRTATLAPSVRRSCPSTTTVAPGSTPPFSTAMESLVRSTCTFFNTALPSFTVNTTLPCWPVSTAACGTTSTFFSI